MKELIELFCGAWIAASVVVLLIFAYAAEHAPVEPPE